MHRARISATGTASQTPSSSQSQGRSKRLRIRNTKVRRKDRIADTTPLEKAVKRAEAKILIPVNRKLMENRAKPWLVMA